MSNVRRYQPVGRGETVPDKYGDYCKYEDVEHWIGMYNLCNEREQSLLAERDRLREALEHYANKRNWHRNPSGQLCNFHRDRNGPYIAVVALQGAEHDQ